MLGRKKSEKDTATSAVTGGATAARPGEAPAQTTHPVKPGGKGRPTPKRRDQEAARRKPLVQTDRKSARAADREARRAQAMRTREAMVTGNDRDLPPRDKGPVRRYVRDYVDARWNVGEFMLPLMLIGLAVSLLQQQTSWAITATFVIVYGTLLLAIVDGFLMWRRLRRLLVAKFGEEALPRGLALYAATRTLQMRRGRMPRPQVARGEYPR